MQNIKIICKYKNKIIYAKSSLIGEKRESKYSHENPLRFV